MPETGQIQGLQGFYPHHLMHMHGEQRRLFMDVRQCKIIWDGTVPAQGTICIIPTAKPVFTNTEQLRRLSMNMQLLTSGPALCKPLHPICIPVWSGYVSQKSSDLVRRERRKFDHIDDIEHQGYTLVCKEQEHRPSAFGGPKTRHFSIERENGVVEKECYR